jgi:hypothetical protein
MTDNEKIEQLRALHDAGAFQRKIIERTPVNLHNDSVKLECGHTALLLRSGHFGLREREDHWECSECRKAFVPQAVEKPKKWWYLLGLLPALLCLLWLLWMVPQWTRAGNERERDYQELKRRVSRLEELLQKKP